MKDKLTYGVTTSVLFDMSEANAVFKSCGIKGYHQYMMEHLDEPLPPGPGFEFFKEVSNDRNCDIFICSQNSALTGLRAMRTLERHKLLPNSSCFTNGASPIPYLKAYGVDIFLTSDEAMAQQAHLQGIPSSIHTMALGEINDTELKKKYGSQKRELRLVQDPKITQLRQEFSNQTQTHFVFDLDCVLFGEESESYYKEHGLEAYKQYELNLSSKPLSKGSYYPVFEKLNKINDSVEGNTKPFKISVVTARGAGATLRALNTLQDWGIDLTGEIHFMDGASKGPILKILSEESGVKTVFFDDHPKNIEAARGAGVFAGRAPAMLDEPPKPAA